MNANLPYTPAVVVAVTSLVAAADLCVLDPTAVTRGDGGVATTSGTADVGMFGRGLPHYYADY